MASIHKDPHGRSPYWYCSYRLPDSRRAFKSTKQRERKKAWEVCRTLEKASEKARDGALTEIQVRKLLDEILESVGSRPMRSESVRSFFEAWASGKALSTKPAVHQHYQKAIRKFLELLGERADKALATLTPRDIASFRDLRLTVDHISTGTLLLDMKVIRSALALARRQGLITHNPAEAIELPVNKPLEREVFTSEEIRALLSVASQEWRTLILLGYYLGARLSDAVSLRWESVDSSIQLISYTQAKTARRVQVPIHPDLQEQLLAIAGDEDQHGPLCPSLAKCRANGRHGLSNQFGALLAKAGIDRRQVKCGKNRFSRKSYHALRHSFSSALANVGVPAEVRMKLTGHQSLEVHQRYSHFELEPLRSAVAALPRLAK